MNKNHVIITGAIAAVILILLACFLVTADESDTYTVTYERQTNGEILIETDTFEVGTDAIIETEQNMRDTYGMDTFLHWSPTPNQSTLVGYNEGDLIPGGKKGEEIKLYAIHKTPEYKLSYHANGGNGELPADVMVKQGWVITTVPSELTKIGYKFAEWNTMLNGQGEKYRPYQVLVMPKHDVTLYAMWDKLPAGVTPPIEPTVYTITYDGNSADGSVPSEDLVEENSAFRLPGVSGMTKEGYTFTGWMFNEVFYGIGDKVIATSDITFVAQWEPIPESNIGLAYMSVSANLPRININGISTPLYYVWTEIYLDGELWKEVSWLKDKNQPELGYRPATNFGTGGAWEFDKDAEEHRIQIVSYCVYSDSKGADTFLKLVYDEAFEALEMEIIDNKITNQTNIKWNVTI